MAGTFIDLRSDTVTKPSPQMRQVMMNAEVGDDVFGEDPTVNRLQKRLAQMFGKEDALFVSSGVMGNQLAIKCHTSPGDEVIVERDAHIFVYETGAPALLSGVQLRTVVGMAGSFSAEDLLPNIRPEIYYHPKTALICVENTHNRSGGRIFPIERLQSVYTFARERSVPVHMDGARIWNASVASGVGLTKYGSVADSISVCFSKGLGAPVGSALVGSSGLIERARKFRKMLGGGMRQVGVLAAAAEYALDNNATRLAIDHENAKRLARRISELRGCNVDVDAVETNIVMIDVSETRLSAQLLSEELRRNGVGMLPENDTTLRFVTHLDVSQEDCTRAFEIFKGVVER